MLHTRSEEKDKALAIPPARHQQQDEEDTADGTFTTLDDRSVTVPMMRLDTEDHDDLLIELGYVDDAVVVRLPYQDDEVSMVFVVPNEGTDLATVEDLVWPPHREPGPSLRGLGAAFCALWRVFTVSFTASYTFCALKSQLASAIYDRAALVH